MNFTDGLGSEKYTINKATEAKTCKITFSLSFILFFDMNIETQKYKGTPNAVVIIRLMIAKFSLSDSVR